MPKLINARTRKEYPLDGEVTVFGRLPSSDIRVLEKQVSRRHCRVVHSREGWVLVDTGSMLGTRLNGEVLMRPQCLEAGDEIKVGTEVFIFDKGGASPRGDGKLRPLSQVLPGELLPRGGFILPRPRLLPVAIGGALAIAAIGALVLVYVLTRPTPASVVRQAARLLRERQAKELWDLVSDERKRAMTFDEFRDQVNAVPQEALDALLTLKIGTPSRNDSGVVVPVTVQREEKPLDGQVVLYRQDGQWKIHAAPVERLAEWQR